MWMNLIYLRYLIPLLLSNSLQRVISHTYNKLICNFDEFYELFLTVQESRSDLPILEIRAAGYVDLRSYSGILCLNGPAFLHKNVSTTNGNNVYMVDPAEIQVFESECRTFNMIKPPPMALPVINENTIVTGEKIYGVTLFGDSEDYRMPSKNMYNHPMFGHIDRPPPPPPQPVTGASFAFMVTPTGKLQSGPIPCDPSITGTTVTATCPCYPPTGSCPTAPYRDVTYNPKAYCLSIESFRTNITFVPSPTAVADDNTGYVCTVKEPYSDPGIAIYFKNLTTSDYHWYECPDGDYGSLLPPTPPNISQLIDFRLIDPKYLRTEGSPGKKAKPGYPGYPIPPINTFIPPTYGTFPYPGYYFPGDPNYSRPGSGLDPNATNFANIRYDATECSPEIPKPQDSCDGGNDKACEYLYHVMGVNKIDWYPDIPDTGVVDDTVLTTTPADGPKYSERQAGVWRLEIMHLVEEIFYHACPQVSPMLAPAVNRIIEYYLMEALKASPIPSVPPPTPPPGTTAHWTAISNKQRWNDNLMVEDLIFCHNAINNSKTDRLEIRRVRNTDLLDDIERIEMRLQDPATTLKEASELQARLQQKKYRFPFDVKVMKGPGSTRADCATYPHPQCLAYNINYIKEAAEIDYDLNLAIDLHWKIFNTVRGFCTKFVPVRMPTFDMNFYSDYSKDIFEFIRTTWINADDTDTSNEVFNQLFGAFVNGAASIYLESCMEGAYISTVATQKMRGIRDVKLRDIKKDTPGEAELNYKTKDAPEGGEPVQYNSG